MGKSALILGGNGVLGRAIVNAMKAKSWSVLSLDYTENADATDNLIVDQGEKVQN